MRNRGLFLGLCALFLAGVRGEFSPAGESREEGRERVVIPFDFESKFDEGRYGRMVGDMFWKKLERQGRFVIPESMLDVRGWEERTHVVPNHETPLAQMQRYVRDDFGADIAIWGKVERVPGFDFDVYDVWIHVADFSGPQPQMIHQAKARTKTVSEIPHLYAEQALHALFGRSPQSPPQPGPEVEQRWRDGPNLVQGDFEKGDAVPDGWDPLPSHVSLATATENGKPNRVVRFQFPESVAGTTGVLYYSEYFPITANAMYRFQCRWRTTGSAVKVFIKCYDAMPTRFRRQSEENKGEETKGEEKQSSQERREVYRSQQNLSGPAKTWNVHTEDFTPKHTQFTPKWGRVMLYAYWPEGTVDFDDVIVKQIGEPPQQSTPQPRRPSLETKVLSEEIEKNSPKKKPEPERTTKPGSS